MKSKGEVRSILNREVRIGRNTFSHDLDYFATGTYFVKVSTANGQEVILLSAEKSD